MIRRQLLTDEERQALPGHLVVTALRGTGIILPAAGVIERTAIAGRARARERATDAMARQSG